MADKYCSTRFQTGAELDLALQKAMECDENALRAEAAAERAEIAAGIASGDTKYIDWFGPRRGNTRQC